MAFLPSSPVTGAAVTGLTTPTYTLTADSALSNDELQWYVSALGGTQTGVTTHSATKPFTIRVKKPHVLKQLAQRFYNSVSGRYTGNVPVNTHDYLVSTKAAVDASGLNFGPIRARLVVECAAGIPDVANSQAQLKAALSLLLGAVTQATVLDGVVNNSLMGTK